MSSLRWDDLRILLASVRHGSFSAAAVALNTTQPTISRRIGALEEMLGVQLFLRDVRPPTPTNAALEVLAFAEQMEQSCLDAHRAAVRHGEHSAGVVRLATLDYVAIEWVLPTLERFNRLNPNIRLEVTSSNQIVDLGHNEADIALRSVRPDSGDLVSQRVLSSPLGVFGSPSYIRAHSDKELKQLDWIRPRRDQHFADREWSEDKMSELPNLYSSNSIVHLAAARRGLGVSVLPTVYAPWLMLEARPEPVDGNHELWLVTHRGLRHTPRVAAVWSYLAELATEINEGPARDHVWLPDIGVAG